MRRRLAMVRAMTLALAFVHSFPARRHLGLFVMHPSFAEGWKGFGALFAILLYLLPVQSQARALAMLWRDHRWVLRAASFVLIAVHAVPAWDHVPRFARAVNPYDGWRGIGSLLAMVWFAAPQRWQRRAIAALGRLGNVLRAVEDVHGLTRDVVN